MGREADAALLGRNLSQVVSRSSASRTRTASPLPHPLFPPWPSPWTLLDWPVIHGRGDNGGTDHVMGGNRGAGMRTGAIRRLWGGAGGERTGVTAHALAGQQGQRSRPLCARYDLLDTNIRIRCFVAHAFPACSCHGAFCDRMRTCLQELEFLPMRFGILDGSATDNLLSAEKVAKMTQLTRVVLDFVVIPRPLRRTASMVSGAPAALVQRARLTCSIECRRCGILRARHHRMAWGARRSFRTV